jgi:hypothetical protein
MQHDRPRMQHDTGIIRRIIRVMQHDRSVLQTASRAIYRENLSKTTEKYQLSDKILRHLSAPNAIPAAQPHPPRSSVRQHTI